MGSLELQRFYPCGQFRCLAVRVVEGRTILDYSLGHLRSPKPWMLSSGEVAVVFMPTHYRFF